MSSYVNKKTRVFKEAGDIEIQTKRSDGRMKTYQSATDARAWCDIKEDRRQHILDLIRHGDAKGLSLGKYIPLEAIIDILLATKNAEIKRLQEENEELKRLIKKNGISYDHKPKAKPEEVPQPVKRPAPKEPVKAKGEEPGTAKTGVSGVPKSGQPETAKTGETAVPKSGQPETAKTGETAVPVSEQAGATKSGEKEAGKSSDAKAEKVQDAVPKPVEADKGKVPVGGAKSEESEAGKSKAAEPKKVDVAPVTSSEAENVDDKRKAADGPGGSGVGVLEKISQEETLEKRVSPRVATSPTRTGEALPPKPAGEPGGGKAVGKSASEPGEPQPVKALPKSPSEPGAQREKLAQEPVSEPGEKGANEPREKDSVKVIAEPPKPDKKAGQQPGRPTGAHEAYNDAADREFPDSSTTGDTTTPPFMSDSSDYETVRESPRYPRPISKEDEKAAAKLLAGKSPEDQMHALKDALAERENFIEAQRDIAAAAIEQLENIKDIVDDSDSLKKQREKSRSSTSPLRSRRTSAATGGTGVPSGGGRGTEIDHAGSCKDDIQDLEHKIAEMRNASSPEKAIIEHEVQVLKKYCSKLAAIQEENSELKKERDMLKRGVPSGADDGLRAKLQKLDEVTQERDRLRAKVQQLEKALAGTGNLLYDTESTPLEDDLREDLREDSEDLRRRLENVKGLEDEVRDLKMQLAKANQGGDFKEKDNLLAKIAALEREVEKLRCNLKDMEILKVERDCLKMRLDDLSRVQKDYEDLLKKTQGFDALKAECANYKNKYEELKALEAECNALRAKAQRCEELENERQMLMKEIQDCECCMNNQEDEIKRLACHIECLTQDLDNRQDQMKVKVVTMRAHLEKKDNIIAKSEQQLADVQDELRNSIESLSCETSCLRFRIGELEDEVMEYENIIKDYENTVKSYENKVKEIQTTLDTKEENYKALLEKLENEKNTSAKLEEALDKAIKNDEHLKQMLKQTKCAIKCMTQKLGKHDIVDMGKLESERENYLKKISELEDALANQDNSQQPCGADQINELEEELMKANATINSLRENLLQMEALMEENESLKKLAAQLQEAAKNQGDNLSRKSNEEIKELKLFNAEKDKVIDDLQNELLALKQQLEKEKQLRIDAQAAAEIPPESPDTTELSKLKGELTILQAEIDRLNFELANQKRECEDSMERLKAKMEQGNDQVTDVTSRMKQLEAENSDLQMENERLNKENELLKSEIDKMRKAQSATSDEIDKLKQELASKVNADNENTKLQDEINKLKQELASKADDKHDKDLQDEINKLKQELDSKANVDKENKDLKDEINKLKQELAAKEKEGKDLKDEINKLKQELDTKEKEAKDVTDQINKLKQELASAGAAAKEDSAKEANFAKERDELLKQIAAQKKEIADLLDKIKQPAKTEDDATFKELQNKNKENENLRSTIADLEKQLKDLQKAQLEVPKPSPEIDKAVNDLRMSLENEENKVRELEETLKKCLENSDRLKNRITELETENANLKAAAVIETTAPVGDDDYKKKALQLEAQLAKQKAECNNMIESLKEQYDRDIKNLQKQNQAAIDKLQKAQQEAMDRLIKEHEEEVDGLKQQLKHSEQELKKKEELLSKEEVVEKPPEEPPKEEEPKEEEPEEKSKKLSMQTFDDVCICGKLPTVIPLAAPRSLPAQEPCHYRPSAKGQEQRPRSAVPRAISPGVDPNGPHIMGYDAAVVQSTGMVPRGQKNIEQLLPPPMEDRVTSIKKIVELENKLLLKQHHTKQKIDMLQTTVEKFKRELELEKQKNSDLVSRYTNQSKTVANMKVEIDMVKKENYQDKRKLQHLNLTLKNILESSGGGGGKVCACKSENVSRSGIVPMKQGTIPHFHTELSLVKTDDNKYKHNCILKKAVCTCENSSDSFGIDE